MIQSWNSVKWLFMLSFVIRIILYDSFLYEYENYPQYRLFETDKRQVSIFQFFNNFINYD